MPISSIHFDSYNTPLASVKQNYSHVIKEVKQGFDRRITKGIDKATVQKICKVAGRALAEVAISFTINVAVMMCFATPLSIPLVTTALIGAFAGVVVSTAWELYRQNKAQPLPKTDAELKHELGTQNAERLARFGMTNLAGLSGPNIAIHECGHALGAVSFFKNSHPKIDVFPFRGGQTSYQISYGLTKLGKFLGEHRSLLVTAGAGMMISTVFAMLEFGLAHGISGSYPTVSEWMNYHAISQLMNEVVYGLTAFLVSRFDLTHDFVYLWKVGGIHPLIPIALMIALPLAEICLLKWLSSRKKAQAIQKKALPIITG